MLLLNSVCDNPVNNQNSPYFQLNKNNQRLLEILKNRQNFFLQTRLFFIQSGFLEIHTPTIVESPGMESHLEPFATEYYYYYHSKMTYYLPTSPEFSLKEALTSGLEKIFEIAKVFRNCGENSNLHNPDFFPNETISFPVLFDVMFDTFIRGICSEEGKCYYEKKIKCMKF